MGSREGRDRRTEHEDEGVDPPGARPRLAARALVLVVLLLALSVFAVVAAVRTSAPTSRPRRRAGPAFGRSGPACPCWGTGRRGAAEGLVRPVPQVPRVGDL